MAERFAGLPYPISKDAGGLFHKQSGIDQIKSDLLILLLTNPGERCVVGNTTIPLANGENHPIEELVGKNKFWVYSYDKELDKTVPGLAFAFKTIENAEIIEVVLDNEESVRCTKNHLWLMRDGSYKRADELEVGDSLMPFYRNLNTSKYERIYQPYLKDYRETHLCFVEGKRESGSREVVHHMDLNKRNNSPDNLQWMTREDHITLHKKIRNAFDKKIKEDPNFKADWVQKVKKGLKEYYKHNPGSRKGAKLAAETKRKLSENKKQFYSSKEGKKVKEKLRKKALKQFKEKGHPTKGMKHTEESKQKMRCPRYSIRGENNPSKRPEVKEKLKAAWEKRRKNNHKVKEIKQCLEKQDCYDLHVEKYHNFAISAGVFVHNCMLPDFGTNLRQLLFEPNDEVLEQQAVDLIAASIRAWEPRVTIDQIEVKANPSKNNLNNMDDLTNKEHILFISIRFFDPEDIQEVQELRLEVPLPG